MVTSEHSGLQLYLNQLDAVISARLSIPSLMMALPLPEALGRLEFGGRNGGSIYKKWWQTRMPSHYQTMLNGDEAWRLRCDLFHNLGGADASSDAAPIAFTFSELSMFDFHGVNLKVGETSVTVLTALILAKDIHSSSAEWLAELPSGYDEARMNRMLNISVSLMEPLGAGLPLITLRDQIHGECVELSL